MLAKRKNKPKVSVNILKNHFFEFFSASELFKMRLVCKDWKVEITEMWHGIFMREMHNHLLISQCNKEVETAFKKITIQQPVSQKFAVFASTLSELHDWEEAKTLASEPGPMKETTRLLITALAKLVRWTEVEIETLSGFTHEHYEEKIHPLLDTLDFKTELFELVRNKDKFLTLGQLHHFNTEFL